MRNGVTWPRRSSRLGGRDGHESDNRNDPDDLPPFQPWQWLVGG